MTLDRPVYDKVEAIRSMVREEVEWWDDLHWWERVLLRLQGHNLSSFIRANVIGS